MDYREDIIKESQKKLKEKNLIPFLSSSSNYNHVEYIKNFIKQMALGKEIQGFIKQEENKLNSTEINDLRSFLIVKYIGTYLTGEVWKIKNIGIAPVKLSPKDFYSDSVLAVGLELSSNLKFRILNPDSSCFIYIVKKINKDEELSQLPRPEGRSF